MTLLMRFQHIRTLILSLGLMALLAAGTTYAWALSDDQIQSQIERELLKDEALQNVTVSLHGDAVSGSVPSLWAKEAAIEEARAFSPVHGVATDALQIESAESDAVLAQDVVEAIRDYEYYTAFDFVEWSINYGVVMLTG